MTLHEIEEAIYQLSPQEQAKLLETLMDAMKQSSDTQGTVSENRHELSERLRGCLKRSGQEGLSDRDVERMREERLVEKYLQ